MAEKIKPQIVVGACIVAAAVFGAGAGTVASAASPAVRAANGGDASVTLPDPEWDENASGESYGSLLESNTPENEPDLILAVATNGVEGYIRAEDLAAANGTEASATFKSPEEALEWQQTEGAQNTTIPVYNLDGSQVVGEFLVVGYDEAVRDSSSSPRG